MAGDVAYVQLSGATLGLYAGMEAQELQQLVRVALPSRGGACCGFQVAAEPQNARSGRKKRIPRLVPLAVACQAPELLAGRVSPLFAPSDGSEVALGAENERPEDGKDGNRLEKLLQALGTELQLSTWERAVLEDICNVQKDKVLKVMSGGTSVDQKKDFLIKLLRPEDAPVDTTSRKKDRQEDTLQAELVAQRVAAIGRRVFSPQVQMQVLSLAETSRDQWGATGGGKHGRFADTMELLAMVERLLDKHVLKEEHGAHLLELVLGENRVLLSALQSYKNDGGSLSDLETTAKRLAALGCDPPKPISSKRSRGKSPRRLAKANGSPAKQRVRDAAAATPSAVSVVRSLHAQHMLTSLELDIIQALVAQDDTQVLQILRDFEQSDHRDVSALRDALVNIVEEITVELGDEEKAAAAFARGMDDAVREENQWEDSDDDEGDSFGWQRHLSSLLGQWQAQHHLTPADANTLRRMVAQQHNLLESAYEVFAGDGDASELLDTLQRVAKLQRQIEQSQAGRNVRSIPTAGGLNLEDVVRQMQRRGVVQAGDAAGLLVLFHGGNEALQAANEAFQADGDVHELEETLLLVVKHARFGNDDEPIDEGQAVSKLLAEYGRSGRLELWQIQLLMSLLKAHDPRLLAAVDVYGDDKNAEELIETLEILVELAAWERHRRAMVHDWIAPLARSGKLPRGGADRLVQLVKARDDRVVAALVVYLSDGNKEEFVDTLARIACLEAMKLKNVQADARQDESKEGHLVLVLLKELEDKGVMTGDEREHTEELVCNGEPRMLAAMDVLASTHDAEDFADTARRILAIPHNVEEAAVAETSTSAAPGTPKTADVEEGEATKDETDAEVPQESGDDTPFTTETHETVEQVSCQESEQVDEPDEKEEQEQKNGDGEKIATQEVEKDASQEAEETEGEGEKKEKPNAEDVENEQTQEEQN